MDLEAVGASAWNLQGRIKSTYAFCGTYIAVTLKLTWTVCAPNEAKEKALLYWRIFSLKFLASLADVLPEVPGLAAGAHEEVLQWLRVICQCWQAHLPTVAAVEAFTWEPRGLAMLALCCHGPHRDANTCRS
jgi:hypothetical protein